MESTTGVVCLVVFFLLISFCASFIVFYVAHTRWSKRKRASGINLPGQLLHHNVDLGREMPQNEDHLRMFPHSPSSLYLIDLNAMLVEVDGVGFLPDQSTPSTSEGSLDIPTNCSVSGQPLLTRIAGVFEDNDPNRKSRDNLR
ncbi:uncharacterized protein LOC135197318 [Macrobrachium nipponense]|uniref:uncharacterized protein LOC135197318 n=1 Tax=Macrobrachium nipponense TaxID=159736 RepID=UPI0030C7DCD5